MKMVRKQFYITDEQDATLKQLAKSTGVTEAELVRMALNHLTDNVTYTAEAPESNKRLRETALMDRYTTSKDETDTLASAQGLLEDSAWQQELAFMRSLGDKELGSAGGAAWRFDREEVYEERLGKILRRH